jgi:hypothetical protein
VLDNTGDGKNESVVTGYIDTLLLHAKLYRSRNFYSSNNSITHTQDSSIEELNE